jgi:hypothetical protein
VSDRPVESIPPAALLGPSDWDDEDLLTVAEASARLAGEIKTSRRRIIHAEETLADGNSSAAGAEGKKALAAERARLAELTAAAERIKIAQANAPS